MTCRDALQSMLDAELDALAGRGTSPLAAHLRECARCHAVAARLVGDTRALATVVASGEPRGASRVPRVARPIGIAAAALAAALVFLLWRGAPHPSSRTVAVTPPSMSPTVPRVEPRTPPTSAPTRPPISTERSVRRPAPALPAAAPRAVATSPLVVTRALAFEPVVPVVVTPVVAARVDPVPVVPDPAAVTEARSTDLGIRVIANPAQGRRAVVMRTSDPGITVVWLY